MIHNETIEKKTLAIIKETPGKNGLDIVAMYRPARLVIRSLQKKGKIKWNDTLGGWAVTDTLENN